MSLTLQLLVDTDVAGIDAQASAWEALGSALDDATESLIDATFDLAHVWSDGVAAVAAGERAQLTRREASNAVVPCRAIGRALSEHAATVRGLQTMLHQIIADARAGGYVVDVATGTVSAAETVYERASTLHVMQQQMDSLAQQLQGVLERAADSDARTTTAINANLPDQRDGFGSAAAAPVGEDQVRSQQGRPPAEVNQWWDTLSPEQQEQAIRDFPQLVGWLDGVPADDRDAANRSYLAQRTGQLDAEAAAILERQRQVVQPRSAEDYELWHRYQAIQKEREELAAVQAGLDRAGPQGLLLGVDTAGDGRAIIAIGNPDTAAHTAAWVPGLGTTIGSTKENVERMVWLNEEAQKHVNPGETVSTVYWLGYDAPEFTNTSVAESDRSRAGAGPYVTFMQGMRATHEGEPGHLVAMGHSYGSTVIGEAALTGNLPVDDFVTQGSPGVHTDHASKVLPDPRHVWVGSSPTDPVSTTGGLVAVPIVGSWLAKEYDDVHGPSPQSKSFGANEYDADTFFHTRYWEPDSDSLLNQAAIVAGRYSAVELEHGQKPENWK
ncbi:alpha/beta hydrolase [Actinoplanes sp. NPDC051859]|uniref:alpha/beta hydrolase n=1 Tax=Actinoplanes sp. NPDC051859 TaxID=3363909 RepID=UPI0037AD1FCF